MHDQERRATEKKLRGWNTIRTKGVLLSASRCVLGIRTGVVKWKVYTGEWEWEISDASKRIGRRSGMREQSATDPCAECVRVSGMEKLEMKVGRRMRIFQNDG